MACKMYSLALLGTLGQCLIAYKEQISGLGEWPIIARSPYRRIEEKRHQFLTPFENDTIDAVWGL